VIDSRSERYLRRLERIVSRKVDVQKVHAATVWGVGRAHDSRLPMKQVVADWPCRAVRRRIFAEVLELLMARQMNWAPCVTHERTSGVTGDARQKRIEISERNPRHYLSRGAYNQVKRDEKHTLLMRFKAISKERLDA
jgi:hypothetical protein